MFASDPNARISNSPASSPRIVDSPFARTRSVHPEMEQMMRRGLSPGADFFEDTSADEEEVSRLKMLGRNRRQGGNSLGQGARERDELFMDIASSSQNLTALPPLKHMHTEDSGAWMAVSTSSGSETELNPKNERPPTQKALASQVSLRRMGAKVVHNTGSPKSTPRNSTHSDRPRSSLIEGDQSSLQRTQSKSQAPNEARSSAHFRHRSNTTTSSRNESILNAHALTVQALLSLDPDVSISHTAQGVTPSSPQHEGTSPAAYPQLPHAVDISGRYSQPPHAVDAPGRYSQLPLVPSPLFRHRSSSTPAAKKVNLEVIDTQRPSHLPPHFLRTPYPFSPQKTFPKPRSRPRESGTGQFHSDTEALRYDRPNEGPRRRTSSNPLPSRSKSIGQRELTVLLSLRRNTKILSPKTSTITIPSSLTTLSSRPGKGERTGIGSGKRDAERHFQTLDFDDEVFGTHLQKSYKRLAGGWFWRFISARKLKAISVGSIPFYSGPTASSCSCNRTHATIIKKLLAARDGILTSTSSATFSEAKLMALYLRPKTGKARYTWVHWARRVAASNAIHETIERSREKPKRDKAKRQLGVSTNGDGNEEEGTGTATRTDSHHSNLGRSGNEEREGEVSSRISLSHPPDFVTTIEFVEGWDVGKVLGAVGAVMGLSVLATLLWVFFGVDFFKVGFRNAGERVGPGLLMGILVGGLGMGCVGVWGWICWVWV